MDIALADWKQRELNLQGNFIDHRSEPKNIVGSLDSLNVSVSDFREATLHYVMTKVLLPDFARAYTHQLTVRDRDTLGEACERFNNMMMERTSKHWKGKGRRSQQGTFYGGADLDSAEERRRSLCQRYGLSEEMLSKFAYTLLIDMYRHTNGSGGMVSSDARIDLISEAIRFEQSGGLSPVFYQYEPPDSLKMRGLLGTQYQASKLSASVQTSFSDSVITINVHDEPWGQMKQIKSPIYHCESHDEKYMDTGDENDPNGSRIITLIITDTDKTIEFRERQCQNAELGRLENLDDVTGSNTGADNINFSDINGLSGASGKLVQYIQGGRDITSMPIIVETIIPEDHHAACALNEALLLQVATMIRMFDNPTTQQVQFVGAFGDVVPVDLPAYFYNVFVHGENDRLRKYILGYITGERKPGDNIVRLRRFLLYCHILSVIIELRRMPAYMQELLRKYPSHDGSDIVSHILTLINNIVLSDVGFNDLLKSHVLHDYQGAKAGGVNSYKVLYDILEKRSSKYYSQMF